MENFTKEIKKLTLHAIKFALIILALITAFVFKNYEQANFYLLLFITAKVLDLHSKIFNG